jgi:hypothetical protein
MWQYSSNVRIPGIRGRFDGNYLYEKDYTVQHKPKEIKSAKGDTVTYTLRVLNGSQQNYEGLLIQLPVPEHGEIVAVNGEKAKNNLLKLTANVAAGDELTVTYTVKAVGEVGSVLKTGTGYVHAIPLPNLNTVITSANPDPAAVKAALDASKTGDAFLAAYLDAMGYAVSIPSGEEICKALCERKSFGDYKLYWPRETAEIAQEHETLAKMQIPDFFGGQSVATTSDHLRVKELRAQDLQAGDVLLWCDARGAETTVAIHDGENLLLPQNGQLVPMSQEDLDAFIMHYYFIALRPTQAL